MSSQQAWTIIPGDKAFASSTNFTGTAPASPTASYSSGGGTINVTNITTGQYRVDFPNLGSTVGGHVQVMNRAADLSKCKVSHWWSSGSTLQVFVNCFSWTGAPVNSVFAMNYVRRSDAPGPQAAYVWGSEPTTPSYPANPTYSWNSTGSGINIARTGTGAYSVQIVGQSLNDGTVEVTAYGGSNSYCKVGGWGGGSVLVRCFDGTTGAPADSQFTMLYSNKSPNGTPSSSYAWVDDPFSATPPNVIPSASYRLGLLNVDTNPQPSVVSSPSSVEHLGTGRWRVLFPAMASIVDNPANVKVTAYGHGAEHCKAVSWGRLSGSTAFATVYCLSSSNTFVDTQFTITYSSFAYTVG
ncbi:MAG TPA: hypothetical protein VFZ53_09790 [Polyangiaceae bacterium]